MYTHLLIPTDGTPRSQRAIEAGIEVAKRFGAQITALYVGEATYLDQIDNSPNLNAQAALDYAAKIADNAGLDCKCVLMLGEAPAHSIVTYAQQHGCDLIVMGTRGQSRVGKFLLGSAATSVLAECDIPVLLYR